MCFVCILQVQFYVRLHFLKVCEFTFLVILITNFINLYCFICSESERVESKLALYFD